jgi:hypothetical protein
MLYRTLPCVYPECGHRPTCFCHYSGPGPGGFHTKHRGSGGAGAGWGLLEGFPGCAMHHGMFDHQWGSRKDQEAARAVMIPRIFELWRMMLYWEEVYDLGPEERVEEVRAWKTPS